MKTRRKAQLIHKFSKGETIIDTVLMGDNEDVLIILTNKGVYKVDTKIAGKATVSAIRP
jgi:hypothetical protein